MKQQMKLELSDVKRAMEAAEAKAIENNWAVSICVCDTGGYPLGLIRMDGAMIMSASTAEAKAKTSAITNKTSAAYDELLSNGKLAILALPAMPFEGGEPIIVDGNVIGAVGVSGVKPAQDAEIARAGIDAILSGVK